MFAATVLGRLNLVCQIRWRSTCMLNSCLVKCLSAQIVQSNSYFKQPKLFKAIVVNVFNLCFCETANSNVKFTSLKSCLIPKKNTFKQTTTSILSDKDTFSIKFLSPKPKSKIKQWRERTKILVAFTEKDRRGTPKRNDKTLLERRSRFEIWPKQGTKEKTNKERSQGKLSERDQYLNWKQAANWEKRDD